MDRKNEALSLSGWISVPEENRKRKRMRLAQKTEEDSQTIPKTEVLCQPDEFSSSNQVDGEEVLIDEVSSKKVKLDISSDLDAQAEVCSSGNSSELNDSEKVLESIIEKSDLGESSAKLKISSTSTMLEKWEASKPYNLFLSKVIPMKEEHTGIFSASFSDFFDPSLGDIQASCHINFMVESNWLLDQIMVANAQDKPTRVICGDVDDENELKSTSAAFSWFKYFTVKSPHAFGHHHTKLSMISYKDGSIRFFVYTANLIESDWDKRTQGIWISPKCPKIQKSDSLDNDSKTRFKRDIIEYLKSYPVKATMSWIDAIKQVDCSSIKVFLVASAPITSKSMTSGFEFGMRKMETILKKHRNLQSQSSVEPNWPFLIQCSSIGSLGKNKEDWLAGEFLDCLSVKSATGTTPIRVIYPSVLNVRKSYDKLLGGGCLPYSDSTHEKQKWLGLHFCQWKAERSGRSKAVPHIKSYCRVSPEQDKMSWFLLTSANLSKAAWGWFNKAGDRLMMRNWEAGVLFIPEMFDMEFFQVSDQETSFPLHYDLPVTQFEKSDTPYFVEILHTIMAHRAELAAGKKD